MTSEHISETGFCEPFNCSHCDKKFAEKPTARISLAQKLDIIEASKKSGFSIEDVMKKYGLKKFANLKNSNALNVNKSLDKNYSTPLNVSKSFRREPFNSHKWFSSELLFTLRAVEWLKGSEPAKMKPDLNLSQLDEELKK